MFSSFLKQYFDNGSSKHKQSLKIKELLHLIQLLFELVCSSEQVSQFFGHLI